MKLDKECSMEISKRNLDDLLNKKIEDIEFVSADYFDLDRMKEALESKEVEIPDGLTKEELRNFLLGEFNDK